jgi:hypothetical protein
MNDMPKKFEPRYAHSCDHEKVKFTGYKKSIYDSDIPKNHLALIWEFYVTRTLTSEGKGLSRKLNDYGWNGNDYRSLEKQLCKIASMKQNDMLLIRSKSISETMKAMDMDEAGCPHCSRMIMKRDFSIESNENDELKFFYSEPRVYCLFRHIRNSLAHSQIYLFDNDFVMFEDKEDKTITAKILIPRGALLDWIWIIDKNGKYYRKDDYIDEEHNVAVQI